MSNILVTTFGGTWAILPELLGFCCYPQIKTFAKNKSSEKFASLLRQKGITNVDELWVICTHGKKTDEAIEIFGEWYCLMDKNALPTVRYIGLEGITDLTNEQECLQMTDLIFRTVLKGIAVKQTGKLLLSLAGGRKTMSSDMQRASDLFGCDILFHIADTGTNIKFNQAVELTHKLEETKSNSVFPVEIKGYTLKNPIITIPNQLITDQFPLELNRDNKPSTLLLNEINKRLNTAESLHFNAYKNRTGKASQSVFQG